MVQTIDGPSVKKNGTERPQCRDNQETGNRVFLGSALLGAAEPVTSGAPTLGKTVPKARLSAYYFVVGASAFDICGRHRIGEPDSILAQIEHVTIAKHLSCEDSENDRSSVA